MGIFVDSGFFLGLLHRKDKNHLKCKEDFKKISTGEFGLIYTSSYVISETATLILIRTKNNSITLDAFKELIYGDDNFIRIFQSNPYMNKLAWDIFITHNQDIKDKRNYLSYVDATNIAFCRENQILNILAVDNDFDLYLNRL